MTFALRPAQRDFETLRARDPCRLEQLDIYSNVLYVKEAKARAAPPVVVVVVVVEHACVAIDRARRRSGETRATTERTTIARAAFGRSQKTTII